LQRLHLDRLPKNLQGRSLEVSAIQLMGAKNQDATDQARRLIERTRTETTDATTQQNILELIQTIFIYKFPDLSRNEVEEMLGLSELKQTRVYQEAKSEGKLEGRQEERQEIAINLLRRNLPLETTAEVTGLTIAQIQQLQADPK
jgi:predicted transposase/invertase (TIGR01784 family)